MIFLRSSRWIRLLAGSLLQTFFDNYAKNFNIPHYDALFGVFGQENIKKLVKLADNKLDSNLETDVIQM